MTTTVEMSRLQAWRDAFRAEEELCPWPGPRPLRETDTVRLLAGRERDRRLFNHEVQNHRLILLGGESGVGKSSLLDAALVPDLRAVDYEVVSCRDWGADIDTGADILAKAVYERLGDDQRIEVTNPVGDGAPPTAGMQLFLDLDDKYGDAMVLILDQFEELLRYNRSRKEQVVQRLIEIHRKCSLRIVLSFRSEYLHELKDIETSASPFAISRYMLDPVGDRHAKDVIANTREPDVPVMSPSVAREVAARWENARREGGNTTSLTQIGMLHLQAMLYALHALAGDGRIIDESTLARMRTYAADTQGPTDADLFSYGLQEAVSTKLLRCERAALKQGLDRFLVRGAATVLSETVDHLSSGGYKLVREAYDLAKVVLDTKIDACLAPLDVGDVDDDDVDLALRRMLSAIAHTALSDEGGGRGEGLTAPRAALVEAADVDAGSGAFNWTRLMANSAGATASNNPAAGPLRAMSPVHVLIEELRRYAWALVWLKESNLIRITRHGENSMVSLIHDGFGEALLEWSKDYQDRDRAWGMYALTTPLGASHLWHDDGRTWDEPNGTKGSMRGELCGTPTAPIRFGNLVFKGNAIIRAAFENAVFISCDFRGVMFLGCTFRGVTFLNCQLDGAMFSDCTIIGKPEPAVDAPDSDDIEQFIPDNPSFNVPDAEGLADAFRNYREDGRPGAAHLISRGAGRPAYVDEAPLPENVGWLPWKPARGGVVVYGGRVSALTFRGTRFGQISDGGAPVLGSEGQVSFRGVSGSGLDLAELNGADFEFHRCVLRHVALSSARPTLDTRRPLVELQVAVNYSVAIQWWIDQGFRGVFATRAARLVHWWNDSADVRLDRDRKTRDLLITGVGMRDYPTERYGKDGPVIFSTIAAQTNYRRGVHLAQDAT